MSTRRICVFPNDPLQAYCIKGVVKPRYYNPANLFDEVHVISMFNDDVDEEKVRTMAGDATLQIHVVGKVNLLNRHIMKRKIIKLIDKIQPMVLRSYNPILQGWIAAEAKNKLGIPLVISLHTEYDSTMRDHEKSIGNYSRYMKLLYSKYTLEPYSLRTADEVIIIYEFLRRYASSMGAKSINVIHNKVFLSQFMQKNRPAVVDKRPIVLCVGRFTKGKNQQCLIRAIKDLDVLLLLVGDGEEYDSMVDLVEQLGIKDKVRFIKSVPHEQIQNYYASATVFALPVVHGGFDIPSLEAAASGLPVILPKQKFNPHPDIIGDFAMLVDNNPESFRRAINLVLSDQQTQEQMVKKSLSTATAVSGEIMEEKEKRLYQRLLSLKDDVESSAD